MFSLHFIFNECGSGYRLYRERSYLDLFMSYQNE
jgi:hypothetical protein